MKEIAELRRATVIDLSSNNIKFLPVSLRLYFALATNCLIFQLKKNFGVCLARITRLDLSKNKLKFLTDDFCNLINLKHLDLYNNQLESLPLTFGKLSKLRYLDLKGNPLQAGLQKVVGPCLTSKNCLDAAKNIVPFMSELEVKVKAEQAKKEEENRLKAEEEELAAREQARLAKKAARKERVMRERQEKAEAEKLLIPETTEPVESGRTYGTKRESQTLLPSSKNFMKAFLLIFVIVAVILIASFPNGGKVYLQFIPVRAHLALQSVSRSLSSAYKTLSL